MPDQGADRAHQHLWLVGGLGLLAGLAILAFAPRYAAVAQSLFALVAAHVLGALLLFMSGTFLMGLRRSELTGPGLDYGWTPGWMNGLGVAALLALVAALGVQVLAASQWPLVWALLLLAACFAGGNLVVGSFRRLDFAVLPMVQLIHGAQDRILDAGCGAGRTSLALGPLLGQGRIVAVDRFTASYIKGGGRSLLDHNLALAGLSERVDVVQADLSSLPFAEASFDGAVSSAVFDHLGSAKQAALDEVFRVLKPGGRFLVLVWVPSWTTFMVGNLFSFFLSSKFAWKSMSGQAGFHLVAEGIHNFSWYMLLEKPD